MRRRTLFLTATCLTALFLPACGDKNTTLFQATLRGTEEVPPNESLATGVASFTLDGATVRYAIEVRGITGVVGAHIHVAALGVNGPIRVGLFPPEVGPTGPFFDTVPTGAVDGVLIRGSFSNDQVAGTPTSGTPFDDLIAQMRSGNAYANVHTTAFRGGEIRGQIRLVN